METSWQRAKSKSCIFSPCPVVSCRWQKQLRRWSRPHQAIRVIIREKSWRCWKKRNLRLINKQQLKSGRSCGLGWGSWWRKQLRWWEWLSGSFRGMWWNQSASISPLSTSYRAMRSSSGHPRNLPLRASLPAALPRNKGVSWKHKILIWLASTNLAEHSLILYHHRHFQSLLLLPAIVRNN